MSVRYCWSWPASAALLLLIWSPTPLLSAPQPASPPLPVAPEKAPTRATTKTLPATLLAIDPAAGTLRLTPKEGGEPLTVRIQGDSKFTRRTGAAKAADFKPNDPVVARLTFRPAGGEIWLRELWDETAHESYTRARRGIQSGVVAANSGARLDLKRADGSVTSYRITEKTEVLKAGASADLKAFPIGAPAALHPRGLPNGDVMATIVAATPAEVATAHLDGLTNWKGVVASVDMTKGLLVLDREDGARRTIALAPTISVKRGRAILAQKDLMPAMNVTVHLLKGGDALTGGRTADRVTIHTSPRSAGKGAL